VVVEDTGSSALTDPQRRFRIEGQPAGPHRLYVSVVGNALLRRETLRIGSTFPIPGYYASRDGE
jgi:hypothetical protein